MHKNPSTQNSLAPLSRRRRFTILPWLAMAAAVFLISLQAAGQSIGNWTFNGILTGTPGTYNTVSNADFSSSVPIRTFNGGTEYYGENGWPTGSINTSMYMQFSLTPNAGYQLDISSLVLTMRRSNTGSPAGSGPTSWSLRSSLDGFAADIASGSMTLTYANYTITPGASFINLYTPVTFRLYGYNTSTGSGGNSRFVVDNIRVNGIGYLLPARFTGLNAAVAGEKVNLSYKVYNTQKNDQYTIERSSDGTSFITLNTITETDDDADKTYHYTDATAAFISAGQLYYRMRLHSNITADSYSDVSIVSIKNKLSPVKTYISNKQLYINGVFTIADIYHAGIYNTSGQLFKRISFTSAAGYNAFVFPLNTQLPAGCIIHLENSKGYSSAVFSAN